MSARNSTVRILAAAAAVLVALTGCSSDSGAGPVDDRARQETELARRPTAEQEVARLTEARAASVARGSASVRS